MEWTLEAVEGGFRCRITPPPSISLNDLEIDFDEEAGLLEVKANCIPSTINVIKLPAQTDGDTIRASFNREEHELIVHFSTTLPTTEFSTTKQETVANKEPGPPLCGIPEEFTSALPEPRAVRFERWGEAGGEAWERQQPYPLSLPLPLPLPLPLRLDLLKSDLNHVHVYPEGT